MLYEFAIQCSIDSRAPTPTATNAWSVVLEDECFGTAISPLASRTSYSIDLYFWD